MKKLQTFGSSYFKGKSHFEEEDGTQNYLVFQPINKYFKKISNTEHISESKSEALSDEVIKPPTTTDNGLVSSLMALDLMEKELFHFLVADLVAM